MGGGVSKEELLYQEVQNANEDAVRALRRQGAALEWVDKEGRTPLILACTRGELFNMAATLLDLGANINAYRPGQFRGVPLHHAAKRGLDKTVALLVSRGASPLAINDDGITPLELARSRGHVSVVRLLEEHLCLFCGILRELSGLGILETFAPNLVTKKIWAVVIPSEIHPRRNPKFELAIYPSMKVAQPRVVISLSKAEIEEPKLNAADPVLYITEKSTKSKYKLLAENEGDKEQLERLFKACKGIAQQGHPLLVGPPSVPPNQSVLESETASLSAGAPSHSNDFNGWIDQCESHNGWGYPSVNEQGKEPKKARFSGWDDEKLTYNGWGPAESEPSTSQPHPVFVSPSAITPSAPPLPVHYLSLADVQDTAGPTSDPLNTSNLGGNDGLCVICWDALQEGACIPCGHLAGCMSCLAEVQAKKWGCPVCREHIQQVVKVYAV